MLAENIFVSVIGILIAVVLAFFWDRMKKMDKEVNDLKILYSDISREIKNITKNYIDKFEENKDLIMENHIELKDLLTDIKVQNAEQTTFCRMVQEFKKKTHI